MATEENTVKDGAPDGPTTTTSPPDCGSGQGTAAPISTSAVPPSLPLSVPEPSTPATATATATATAPTPAGGFRALYAGGVDAYYKTDDAGVGYRNPHEGAVKKALTEALTTWGFVVLSSRAAPTPAAPPPRVSLSSTSSVLDLAAGSGEVTLALKAMGLKDVTGCDPYTQKAYEARVGTPAESWSFSDVANGVLGEREFDVCVCSYALHLVEASWMSSLLWELARTCSALVIVSPHKRPVIPENNGWDAATPPEIRVERIHVRCFYSQLR